MSTQGTRIERLAGQLGGISNGELMIGAVPITHLARRASTPFYVYSGDAVERQVERVQTALGPETALFYSVKANPSLGLCQVMRHSGVGAEVASAGELVLALRAGFSPDRIIFAGPGKTDSELELAARAGIHAVNVESMGEMERLAAIAQRLGVSARIALRVNPTAVVRGAQMRMGGGAHQFGIDEERLPEVLDRAKSLAGLYPAGIHIYAGTQMFDVQAILAHCHHILDLAGEVAGRLGRPLEFIDMGGGFGVPYFESSQGDFDLPGFGAGYQEIVRRSREDPRLAGSKLAIELGRFLVAEAGVYVTSVVDVKESRGKTFVVTDGGMNHHITATGNFGQVFRKPYPVSLVNRIAPANQSVALCGPCCTPLDVFGHDIPLPEIKVGDLAGVFCSGAYGYSASSLAFLSHPTPAEVLVWRGRVHILRAAGKPDQVLEGQRDLPASALNPE